MQFKESIWQTTDVQVKFLKPDIALPTSAGASEETKTLMVRLARRGGASLRGLSRTKAGNG